MEGTRPRLAQAPPLQPRPLARPRPRAPEPRGGDPGPVWHKLRRFSHAPWPGPAHAHLSPGGGDPGPVWHKLRRFRYLLEPRSVFALGLLFVSASSLLLKWSSLLPAVTLEAESPARSPGSRVTFLLS